MSSTGDDRSVVRSVTVEFHVPEEAPVSAETMVSIQFCSLLSVMRRKTLVNFEIRDHEDRPVAVPSLRQNQAITESLLLACADAVAEGDGDKSAESRREIEDFVHRVVSGAQRELVEAYDSLESGREPEVVRKLAGNRTFKAILDRMADNFILWVMIPTDGPRCRVLKFSCDKPLYLNYRQPGHKNGNSKSDDEVHTYGLGKKLGPWRLTVFVSIGPDADANKISSAGGRECRQLPLRDRCSQRPADSRGKFASWPSRGSRTGFRSRDRLLPHCGLACHRSAEWIAVASSDRPAGGHPRLAFDLLGFMCGRFWVPPRFRHTQSCY